MPPGMDMQMGGMPLLQSKEQGTNLLEVLINIAFGFVAGLIIFLGFGEVITYGTKLANRIFALTPQAQQMAAFGIAANYAPYVILTPLAGVVVKQLTSVRTLKGFGFFVAAVLAGMALAFFTQGYFFTQLSK